MDYSLEVQQRFHSPQGAGEFAEGTRGLATGEAEDRTLNVWVRVQVQVVGTVIRSVRFLVFGCPHMLAAAGWVAEDQIYTKQLYPAFSPVCLFCPTPFKLTMMMTVN